MRRRALILLAASTALACGGDSTAPVAATGTLDVTVVTTGADQPSYHFVCIDRRVNCPTVYLNGTTSLYGVPVGAHTAELTGSDNCSVTGSNPRAITIVQDQATAVAFDVHCAATTGFIAVAETTSGADSTPYLYLPTWGETGREAQSCPSGRCFLRTGGSAVFSYVAAGDDYVTLGDVPANCAVGPSDTLRVSVTPGDTSRVRFAVTCEPAHKDLLAITGFLDEAKGLFTTHPDGTGFAWLDSTAFTDVDWSPDGSRIAFTGRRGDTSAIYVVRANGAGLVPLTGHASQDEESPVWSPDGSRIAFVANSSAGRDVFVADANGTTQINLTNGAVTQPNSPVWSPDGTRIAVWDASADGDIYLVSADGTGTVDLTNGPGVDQYPQWSPDGTRIAFERDRSGIRDVYVIDVIGTGLVNLSPVTGGSGPAWSPDGKRVAYSCGVICTVNPDGSGLVPLGATAPSSFSPRWSPDGLRIAYVVLADCSFCLVTTVFVIDASGASPPHLATPPFITIRDLRWSPKP